MSAFPPLGLGDQLTGGGDAFYFPVLPEGTDPAVLQAQADLAKILVSPEGQLAFNLEEGLDADPARRRSLARPMRA